MTQALCFDMYGTLCDTGSVTTRLAAELGVSGALVDAIDRTWRSKQLQYSYQLSLMDRYEPFGDVTERALSYALARYDLDPDPPTRERILGAYDRLEPFPAAAAALAALRDEGYTCVVLSNGDPEMLRRLIEHTDLGEVLDDPTFVSADEVGVFKPAPAVYENAADRLIRDIGDCRLVSGNAWDVTGADAAGMQTAWVNRRRDPPEATGPAPDVQVRSLADLPDAL